MAAGLTRYELRVSTLLSRAALAAFHIPVTTTAIPRNTVYRFRIPADRDPSEVLHRLTEFDVQVLEIRRCSDVGRRDRGQAPARQEAPPPRKAEPAETPAPAETTEPVGTAAAVVLPFPVRCGNGQGTVDQDGDGWTG
ncbi:MAG TPA: hypothetical protein VGN28_15935 [Blastococcus sp.]|jgi:hypothetical protein|nr:hypothetical protein [Blastococcus sp.]